jgi:phage shock protein PspC (stress-responsive transcriptional regulator)
MSVSEELERLQALRDRGTISESEFAQAKARALDGTPVHSGFLHRLSLSTSDRVIGGVCGGLGAHTGLPSWAWRVIFCISVLYFGIGLLFYVLLWIFVPADSAPPPATPPASG